MLMRTARSTGGQTPVSAFLLVAAIVASGCQGSDPSAPPPPPDDLYGCGDGGRSSLFAQQSVFWGDLHAHTLYSDDAALADSTISGPSGALAWAADPDGGGLDFVALTDHAETLTPEEWTSTLAAVRAASSPALVVLGGFEYTNVSRQAGHGHKCVYFRDLDRLVAEPIGVDACADPVALWQRLDAEVGAGGYITIPHHPAKGPDYGANMSTDWDPSWVDPLRQPLVEIYSVHGCSEAEGCEEPVDRLRAEQTVYAALELWRTTGNPGYRLGIIASTDNHLGRPGNVAEEQENVSAWEGEYTGGLCAVWAPALGAAPVWDALLDRRTYGTTGARIQLEFTARCGDDFVPMGGEITTAFPATIYLHARAAGDDGHGIDQIDVIRNGERIASQATGHLDLADTIDGPAWYLVKVYQEATPVVRAGHCRNERAWSSPVFVTAE